MSDLFHKLRETAEHYGVGSYSRHVFLCIGPDCCSNEEGQAAWEVLKRELKSRGLSMSRVPGACYRTKAGCLRICRGGPILVVYPEGTWYAQMTANRIPRFVQEHLIENRPIEEWIFARNPLPREEPGAATNPSAP
jgi:(2Fe-2S) ferredoxin